MLCFKKHAYLGDLFNLEELSMDFPAASPKPIDAWIDACCGQGEAPNGIDEAVALTKFMVGAYEAYRTGKRYEFPQK